MVHRHFGATRLEHPDKGTGKTSNVQGSGLGIQNAVILGTSYILHRYGTKLGDHSVG